MGSVLLDCLTCVKCCRAEMDYFGTNVDRPDAGDPEEDPGFFLCLRCRDEVLYKEVFRHMTQRLRASDVAQRVLCFVRRQPFRALEEARLTRILVGKPWSTNWLWDLHLNIERQISAHGAQRPNGGRWFAVGSAHLRQAHVDIIGWILSFLTCESGQIRIGEWYSIG